MSAGADVGGGGRAQAEPVDVAFTRVAERVAEGDLYGARELLDALASTCRRAGRGPDESRALRLAATLSRVLADSSGALDRSDGAVRAAGAEPSIGFPAMIELANAREATLDHAGAAEAFGRAADIAGSPADRSAALRRRAMALNQAGDTGEALAVMEQAHRELSEAGDLHGAVHALVEASAIAQTGNRPVDLGVLSAQSREAAIGHPAALADLELLAVAQALDEGDLRGALSAAEAAKAKSLEAVAPLAYVSAVLAVTRIADALGDRARAYGALAAGLRTLTELVGRELSWATFEPELLRLRDQWGAESFDAVKAGYEELRRRQGRGGVGGGLPSKAN